MEGNAQAARTNEGIIRRNLRKASMTAPARPTSGSQPAGRGGSGLESVKKTQQVAAPPRKGLPTRPPSTRPRFNQNVFQADLDLSRPGYVSDDGPRNKTPGHAACGVARRDPDRSVRNVLVSQPRRIARAGRGADRVRDRA